MAHAARAYASAFPKSGSPCRPRLAATSAFAQLVVLTGFIVVTDGASASEPLQAGGAERDAIPVESLSGHSRPAQPRGKDQRSGSDGAVNTWVIFGFAEGADAGDAG